MKFLQKRSVGQRVVFVIVFVLFALYTLMLLYPFVFGFMISLLKDGPAFNKAYNTNSLWKFPSHPNFANFIAAFNSLQVNRVNYFGMLLNSIWFSVGSAAIGVFSSSMCAYVVCKYRFRGSKFIYYLSLFIMLIPVVGALPAQYKLFDQIGMKNSPLIILAYSGGFGYNFLILYSFFKNLSWSYAESAFVDGAGHFTVFFKIMLPQAIGPIMAISVLAFIAQWNDYQTPYLYLQKLPTLASGMYIYEGNLKYEAKQPIYFAGVLLSMLPVIIIFAIFQNSVMERVHTGGLKG